MKEVDNISENLSEDSPYQHIEQKDDYSLSYIFSEGIHYCSELNIIRCQSKMPTDLILSNATKTVGADINGDQYGSIEQMNVAQKQAQMNRRFFTSADETYGVDITGNQCNSLGQANEAEKQTQMCQGEQCNNIFCYNPGHSSEAFERDNLNILQVEENTMPNGTKSSRVGIECNRPAASFKQDTATGNANLSKSMENLTKSLSANIKKSQSLKGKYVDASRLPRPSTNHELSSFATINNAVKTKKPTTSESANSINKGLRKEIPSDFDITKLKKSRGAIPVSKMLPSFRYKHKLEESLKASSISKDGGLGNPSFQSCSPMFFLDPIRAWNNGGNANNIIGGGSVLGNEMNPSLIGSSGTNQNGNMMKENTGGSHSLEN